MFKDKNAHHIYPFLGKNRNRNNFLFRPIPKPKPKGGLQFRQNRYSAKMAKIRPKTDTESVLVVPYFGYSESLIKWSEIQTVIISHIYLSKNTWGAKIWRHHAFWSTLTYISQKTCLQVISAPFVPINHVRQCYWKFPTHCGSLY